MQPFTTLISIAASLPDDNIDTDIIFPARYLLLTEKSGLGKYAFYDKRFDADGEEIADFPLNHEPYRESTILLTGDNFGCGSSREQAPWALGDLGFRCIISTSFGEIFHSNCFRNGMLPINVNIDQLTRLHVESIARMPLTVDLDKRQLVTGQGETISFELADWRRDALMNGWDEIEMIRIKDSSHIAAFEAAQQKSMPWLYDNDDSFGNLSSGK